MSTALIDSHAHLVMVDEAEREAVLERAREAGVIATISLATGPKDLPQTLALAEAHSEVWVCAGCHPHEAQHFDEAFKRDLEAAVALEKVVAVGEIGLDYHYDFSPREQQIEALEWQLDFAIDHDLPVVLHNRESWDDLYPRLLERKGRLRGVAHSFTESPAKVAKVIELGLYVGVSGMVTFKRAENIREMARAVPLDRLLVETDTPYLAPVPKRGKINEPSFVAYTAAELARQLEVSEDELRTATTSNVQRLFTRIDLPL